MKPNPSIRIAVDIGGTFTDVVLLIDNVETWVTKVSTTPADPSIAVIDGIRDALACAGVDGTHVSEVIHGTTVGSNAILQKAGAKTGLLTTRGFRDVLEIGRIRMPEMFDLTWSKPQPLVERRYRLEIDERISAQGEIVTRLNEASVLAAGETLSAAGIESVAICLINSYANPVHEQRVEALLRQHFPQFKTTFSWAVLPEMKEYERTSTTVVNAYLLVAMQDYLGRIEEGLKRLRITAPLLVMTSNGGVMGTAAAKAKPVFAVASGPAGGVVGAAHLGKASHRPNLIVFDMGGTTAKAAIIENGVPSLTSEYEFREGMSTSSRFIKAGGYMLKVPSIDMAEVGAGGGSVARVDAGGLIQVGPESVGSTPGPACYGLGNDVPTVTDANLVLGYLNPIGLAGGQLPIQRQLAERAIAQHIAEPLNLTLRDAAHGIRAVANANMARAIRAVTVERGKDPRDMTMIAFGGNGGVHAIDVAQQLGIRQVIIPRSSGVFSAVGMLAADVEHNFVRVVMREAAQLTESDLQPLTAALSISASAALRQEGFRPDAITLLWQVDVRFCGQASELTVAFELGSNAFAEIDAAFRKQYLATYGYSDDEPLEIVNLRCVGRGLRGTKLDFGRLRQGQIAVGTAAETRRDVSFSRSEAPTTARAVSLAALSGTPLAGPLIVDCFDTSVVVRRGATIHADAHGSLIINLLEVSA